MTRHLTNLRDEVVLIDGRDHCKNWYIQFWSEDVVAVQAFRDACYTVLPKFTRHWFHQGSDAHWQMFEFWIFEQDTILNAAEAVAEKFGRKLVL